MHGSILKALRSPALRNLFWEIVPDKALSPPGQGQKRLLLGFHRKAESASTLPLPPRGRRLQALRDLQWAGSRFLLGENNPSWRKPLEAHHSPAPDSSLGWHGLFHIRGLMRRLPGLGAGRGGEGACPCAPAWGGGNGPSARTEQLKGLPAYRAGCEYSFMATRPTRASRWTCLKTFPR